MSVRVISHETHEQRRHMETKRIAVAPGDGNGPEVIAQGIRVLEKVQQTHGIKLDLVQFDWGAEKFLREEITLPQGRLEKLTNEFDAIYADAYGDPRIHSNHH